MGYWSALHLVDIKIKEESVPIVERAIRTRKGRGMKPLRFFLEVAMIDSGDFLAFRASEDGLDPYVPDEQDGSVPALYGKWYECEQIASWLKLHSKKGGRVVLHSVEADGEAWGWEFDGRGRMRALALCPAGKWT